MTSGVLDRGVIVTVPMVGSEFSLMVYVVVSPSLIVSAVLESVTPRMSSGSLAVTIKLSIITSARE